MKKFTKLFLSCAALAALTATVATSAMAAGITATYDEANATGTLAIAYDEGITVAATDEVTLLVTTKSRASEITTDDILAIDQLTGGNFGTVTLRQVPTAAAADEEAEEAGYLPDGIYYVYVGYTPAGGTFTVLEDKFRVGLPEGDDVKIGDFDTNGDIDSLDALYLARFLAEFDTNIGRISNTETINIAPNN